MVDTWLNRERYRVAKAEEKGIRPSKKRHQEESVTAEAQESMDKNDMQRFYVIVSGARHKIVPMPTMYNDREGNLLTGKAMVLAIR